MTADALQSIRDRAIDILTLDWVKMSTAWTAVETFGELGFEARAVARNEFVASPDRIAFLGGNARWHEPVLDRIRQVSREQRPLVIVWHTEPLPLPRETGLSTSPLTVREIAKLVLRDRRINDAPSNARYMHRLDEEGVVDLLTVSEKSFQAFLDQEGIASEFIPLGYHRGAGHRLNLERDIDVLFLGDQHVRRRKRIIQRLAQEGVAVQAVGDYADPRYWGDSRTELLNRTKVLLNLSRHPGLQNDVRLMIGNDNLKEGFLSSVAFIDGQRVCVMSFSFVDAALFAKPARPTLFVTRKQSGRHPEHLRHFARSFKHTSPAYFCFAAIAGIASALDAQEIAVIRHHAQTGYSPEHADVMRKSYDDFWHSVGACALDEKALQVALPLEISEHGELSAAHRARARKRREQRKAVEESACSTLRQLSRSEPADGPA
jgi:hypothetical protein